MASIAPSPSAENLETVELQSLSVEQLKAVKEQTDLEINLLQDRLNNIRTATSRLEWATSALDDLSLRPPDHRILKTMSEGKDYWERKVNLLKSNFDQRIEVASKKKGFSDEAGAI